MTVRTEDAQQAIEKIDHIANLIGELLRSLPEEAPAARDLVKDAETRIRHAKYEIAEVHNSQFLFR